MADARSEAWQREGADWILEVLDSWMAACAYTASGYKSVIFLLFLWLAVLEASGCIVTMETRRATVTAGGGSVKECGEGGGGGELEGGSGDCSLSTMLSYIASISANKAWCGEALAVVDTGRSCVEYSKTTILSHV